MHAYYRILGVGPNASDKEIRQAFRRLALRYHPDVNKNAEAGERFKEIYEAYQALSEITKRAHPTPDRELTCDMCMGTGEIISRWTQVLGGETLRCPKCLGSGRERLPSGLVNHTPLNCTCVECNRRWAEWKRRSRSRRPRGVVDQAEEIREKCAVGRTKAERSGSGEPAPSSSSSPGSRASQPSPKPKERSKRPDTLRRRPQRKRRHRWLKWTLASIVLITVTWAWAYNQNVPAAVDVWKTSMAVIDGLMDSLLGGNLRGSDGSMGDSEPPPVIIVVTATPEPTPVVIVVTATPKPVPVSAASAPTPAQGSPSAKTSMTLPVATVTPTVVPTATPVRVVASPVPVVVESRRESATEGLSDERYVGGKLLDAREIETWVIEFTNLERAKAGLEPFVHDPAISEIARSHSINMIEHGYGHVVFGKDPTDRALDAGYDCRAYHEDGSYSYGLSENIFRHGRVTQWVGTSRSRATWSWRPATYIVDSRDMARELVAGWMDSSGHRANILDSDSRRIGVGVAIEKSPKHGYISETVYATQNFSSCR